MHYGATEKLYDARLIFEKRFGCCCQMGHILFFRFTREETISFLSLICNVYSYVHFLFSSG